MTACLEMKLSEFDYELDESCIATHPANPRDSSKLLEFSGTIQDKIFSDLPSMLGEGDVIVFNNSKVIPARLFTDSGIEILLHQFTGATWKCFAKPARKLKIGQFYKISDVLEFEVQEKLEDGQLVLSFNLTGDDFFAEIERVGHMPLPPYIKRADAVQDKKTYQTIYAKHEGSVAAPTAGLHFTEAVFENLKHRGVETAEVTLHVGAGTFQPIKTDDISEHKMHSESFYVSAEAAAKIKNAKRVIAVGTTSMRVLESMESLQECSGETDIFISPGYKFKHVDALITNFHLPKSSLLVLVSAFIGTQNMKRVYDHAINNDYRFYSYGDACFLNKA